MRGHTLSLNRLPEFVLSTSDHQPDTVETTGNWNYVPDNTNASRAMLLETVSYPMMFTLQRPNGNSDGSSDP